MKTVLLVCLCVLTCTTFAQDYFRTLETAIRDGDIAQIKTLLKNSRININAADADGTTPLMHAVVNASTDCVRFLLDQGADPNISNKAGATALMWAVPDPRKVDLLIARGAKVNVVSSDGRSPVRIAISLPNSLPVVKKLIANGADVNMADKSGTTPLMAAGSSGNLALVQLLLANGADPKVKTKEGATYLSYLASSNDAKALKWAIEHGFDVKDKTQTVLISPAMDGRLDLVQVLLANGADPNVSDKLGYTPLIHSVITESSSLELVKLLLEHGADPRVKAKDGLTALTFARRKGWSEAIALLMKAGATE